MDLGRIQPSTLRVLQALLDVDGETHGWAVVKATRIGSGTVYPFLARLEEAGWVTSRWDTNSVGDGRQPRRYYRIVDKHRAEAAALVATHLHTGREAAGDATPE